MRENVKNEVDFYELKWDTEFFGVNSAKAILNRPLTLYEWDMLKARFRNYQFISIVNNNSEPINTQLIGKDTSAFLVDVNIQFIKKIEQSYDADKDITIQRAINRNNHIIEIADFQFSKFTEDPELAKRGGNKVYRQWIINSFNNPNKYFAISKGENGVVNGFLLYSYAEDSLRIELIAVSKTETKGGIGTNLFRTVENEGYKRGMNEIKVGTQIRNLRAINFYHKVGCKQVGCHQVYHLWKGNI